MNLKFRLKKSDFLKQVSGQNLTTYDLCKFDFEVKLKVSACKHEKSDRRSVVFRAVKSAILSMTCVYRLTRS